MTDAPTTEQMIEWCESFSDWTKWSPMFAAIAARLRELVPDDEECTAECNVARCPQCGASPLPDGVWITVKPAEPAPAASDARYINGIRVPDSVHPIYVEQLEATTRSLTAENERLKDANKILLDNEEFDHATIESQQARIEELEREALEAERRIEAADRMEKAFDSFLMSLNYVHPNSNAAWDALVRYRATAPGGQA